MHERIDEAPSAQGRLGEEGAHAQRTQLVEPVRVLHDAAGADTRKPVVVQGAQRFEHSLDIAAFYPELGEHPPGQDRRMLLFRHVIFVVFALVKLARVMVERHEGRKEGIDPFHSGYLMGNGRRAPGVLQEEFRRRLVGQMVVCCLGLDKHLLDAGVKPGKARLQQVSHVVH